MPIRRQPSAELALTWNIGPDEVARDLPSSRWSMNPRAGKASVTLLIALMIGCASPPPPANAPSQVQVSFNFNPPGGSRKGIERGAVSGVPQHVGFFYSVNPDCSSDGLVQTRLS